MQMTENEIVSHYKRNGEKNSQIQILADLNGCSKEEIQDILKRNGCEIKEPKKKEAKEKAAVQQETINIPLSVWATIKEKETFLRGKIAKLERELELTREELIEHEIFSKKYQEYISETEARKQ